MKRIAAKTWATFSEAHAELTAVRAEIESVIAEANAKLEDLKARANDAREMAHSALDEAATDAETYFDERSEKWQEGDAGSAYSEWKDELSNARDTLAEDLNFEIEDPDGLGTIDDMLEALDGGLRQAPGE